VLGLGPPLLHLGLVVVDPGEHLPLGDGRPFADRQFHDHPRLPGRHLHLFDQRHEAALEHRLGPLGLRLKRNSRRQATNHAACKKQHDKRDKQRSRPAVRTS